MFQSPHQNHLLFKQPHIISVDQTYPCPRCEHGLLEPYGHTETLNCLSCDRFFVPLRGGRKLFPANRMGWKIAPTYWWDGLKWHWAGTTATARQLTTIVLMFMLSLAGAHFFSSSSLLANRPDWLNPVLIMAITGLVTMQLIYYLCWDFEFISKRRNSQK
ncbi:MAG: hypothetical protein KIT34_18760 [Cyanobacteria bacterium TGS_CYA1]|nr:hypothetical protein [Cyanobacteria bacterium TGS_CYA1]